MYSKKREYRILSLFLFAFNVLIDDFYMLKDDLCIYKIEWVVIFAEQRLIKGKNEDSGEFVWAQVYHV